MTLKQYKNKIYGQSLREGVNLSDLEEKDWKYFYEHNMEQETVCHLYWCIKLTEHIVSELDENGEFKKTDLKNKQNGIW